MAKYNIVIKDHATQSTFGPGAIITFVPNAVNIAWTEYINDVGEAFFTLAQGDPAALALATYIDRMPHVEIYRNGEKVWAGWISEVDETPEDVIVYAYSYVSGLYLLHSEWNQEWENVGPNTIISDLWTRASNGITLVRSRMGWMSTGTIEQLWTESGGPTALQLPLYRAYYKRILSAFQELTAYAISDTTNVVLFEVTPSGVFNLWRNRTSTVNDIRFSYEHGYIRNYRRLRVPIDSRNYLRGVGSSPTSLILLDDEADVTHRNTNGRLEEAIYLPWVRDTDELTRVLKLRLARSTRTDTDLMLTFAPDAVTPARATSAVYTIGDSVNISLPRGISKIDAVETKLVVGQQVVFFNGAESVRVLLADRL